MMASTKQIKPFMDEEYFDLVPRPNKEQRKMLKESIRSEGMHEPIIVNKDGKILDGYTRFEICEELKIKPKFIIKEFSDTIKERLFVITTNLRRRQLNNFQMFELVDKEREILANKANEHRKQLLSEIKLGNREKLTREEQIKNSTNYKIGQIVGLHHSTVAHMVYIKRYGKPEEIQTLRDGEIGTDTVFRRIVKQKWQEMKPSKKNFQIVDKICPMCGKLCRKRNQCHVHKKICCSICEWGE